MKAPCYKCEDRKLSCHTSCKKYIDWLQEKRKENKYIKKSILDANDYIYREELSKRKKY